jgi:hypothetical protein
VGFDWQQPSAEVVISPGEHHATVASPEEKNIEAFSRLFPTRYSRLCDGHLALHPGPPNHLRARLGARIKCTEDINIKKQSSSKRAAFRPVGQQFITLQIPSTARSRLA